MLGLKNKSMESLLLASLLTVLPFAPNAHAGNHGGGGHGVKERGQTKLADYYQPKSSNKKFEPDGEPIAIEERFPHLREEVEVLSKLLYNYGVANLQKQVLPIADEILNFTDRVLGSSENKGDSPKYYLVSSFPNEPECNTPRDNSGVPEDATVYLLGCTRGNITLLLENPKNKKLKGFSQLDPKVQADLLAHEAFRRSKHRIATESIERIINGLKTLRDLQEKQAAKDRRPLSKVELAKIQTMMDELPLAGLGAGPTENYKVWPNGGGLVTSFTQVDPSAFISVGSVVQTKVIKENVTIVNSSVVYSWETNNYESTVNRGTIIENSDVRFSKGEIGENVHISDSTVKAYQVNLGAGVKILSKSSVRGGDALTLGPNVQIIASDLFPSTNDTLFVTLDNGATIQDSTVELSFEEIDRVPRRFLMRKGATLKNHAHIFVSESWEQEQNSIVDKLRLRVRPYQVKGADASSLSRVVIFPGVTVIGPSQPIVLMTEAPGLKGYIASTPNVVQFVDNVTISEAFPCKMGYDSATSKETGIPYQGVLTISSPTSLSRLYCRTDSEKLDPVKVQHLWGTMTGHRLEGLIKFNEGHAGGCL